MTQRTSRGVGHRGPPQAVRSACRVPVSPIHRGFFVGFRVAVREAGALRVLRGGSWGGNVRWMRSAYWGWSEPGFRYVTLGFRVVVRDG